MPENYNIADLAKLMRQAKANDIPFVFFQEECKIIGNVSIWNANAHCHIYFCEHRNSYLFLPGDISLSTA